MSSENVNNEDDVELELLEDFSKEMRKVTRKIHNLSDALVNAKLGIAMSDDRIWAEGLLVFYEIFKFLENTMKTVDTDYFTQFKDVLITNRKLGRTEAFEKDIQFYYGSNYLTSSSYVIRSQVADYLSHLEKLKREEPIRLLAYIYHLYMGLFSGGQILKKKRQFKEKIKSGVRNLFGQTLIPAATTNNSDDGNHVVNFENVLLLDGKTLLDIKKEVRFTMNEIASSLNSKDREAILDESILVFQNNNLIVQSIKNVNSTAFLNVITNPYVIVLLINVSAILFFILK